MGVPCFSSCDSLGRPLPFYKNYVAVRDDVDRLIDLALCNSLSSFADDFISILFNYVTGFYVMNRVGYESLDDLIVEGFDPFETESTFFRQTVRLISTNRTSESLEEDEGACGDYVKFIASLRELIGQ
jgi:hypothetical protein